MDQHIPETDLKDRCDDMTDVMVFVDNVTDGRERERDMDALHCVVRPNL